MPSLELKDILDLPKMPAYLEAVNKNLELAVKSSSPGLKRPLLQVVKAKSKRLRPALVLAAAGGNPSNEIITAGTALELLHLGSLVHDDIIDNADSRWGKPTISKTDGPAAAILVGDYLLANATSQASKINAETAQLVSQTITSLVNGESLEANEDYNLYRTEQSYFECIQQKTAALISVACRLGGTCTQLDQPQVKSLSSYGKSLGISFQLIDDLLDVLSTSKLMGKPVGNDAKNGVYTLPVIYSLHSGSQQKLKKLLKDPKHPSKDLAGLLLSDGSIQKTMLQINNHNLTAQKYVEGFSPGLHNLPTAYLDWALNNLVLAEYRAEIR